MVAEHDVGAAGVGGGERVERGERDAAIVAMRRAVDELRLGYPFYGLWATGVLVETLLARGTPSDLAEAQVALEELANLWAGHDLPVREILLLRLGALRSRADGDRSAHLDLLTRYRALAESLGFEGHIDWAEAMAQDTQR